MTQSVAKFTMFVIRFGVSDVVDKQIHYDENLRKQNIYNWCEKFISIITSERDELCNLILAGRSGIDVTKENIDSVPKMVVDRLQDEMKSLINEKAQLELMINKYVDYVTELKKVVGKLEKKNKTLEKAIQSVIKTQSQQHNKSKKPFMQNNTAKSSDETTTYKKPVHSVHPVHTEIPENYEKTVPPKNPKYINKLTDAEFSGEDFDKPLEDDNYLEKAGSVTSKKTPVVDSGSSYDSDEVIESIDEDDASLGSEDELEADE